MKNKFLSDILDYLHEHIKRVNDSKILQRLSNSGI